MNGILFACDLDNTLLYSYKYRKVGDLCVEMLHGKEHGFMTPHTIELLKDIKNLVDFVPVTTRSIEQYGRIIWPTDCTPKYAIVANGAVLLKDGKIERAWREASEYMIAPYKDELLALMLEFTDPRKFLRCRIVDDAYMFVYCYNNISPMDCVCTYGHRSRLKVVCSGKKVYFFPPAINKGSAIKRLKAILRPITTIVAGDSTIDIPMLNKADLAIIPASFQESAIQTPYIKASESEISFSEFALAVVRLNI